MSKNNEWFVQVIFAQFCMMIGWLMALAVTPFPQAILFLIFVFATWGWTHGTVVDWRIYQITHRQKRKRKNED